MEKYITCKRFNGIPVVFIFKIGWSASTFDAQIILIIPPKLRTHGRFTLVIENIFFRFFISFLLEPKCKFSTKQNAPKKEYNKITFKSSKKRPRTHQIDLSLKFNYSDGNCQSKLNWTKKPQSKWIFDF